MSRKFSLKPRDVARVETEHRRIVTAIPAPESVPLLEELEATEPRSMAGQPPVIWERADDTSVFDPYGNRWIDFSSGVLVANTGHTPPAVASALREQIDRGLLFSYCFPSEPRLRFMETLKGFIPDGYKAFLLSTGGEAIENIIKLLRTDGMRRGGRAKRVVVSFENGFHGRTMGAQLAGGFPELKQWIGRTNLGFVQVPFPSAYWSGSEEFGEFAYGLERSGVDPLAVAGVLMESYQGGTGSFAPVEYVQTLREWCDQHGALLAFDEVQSGMGRTGKLFAFEHYGTQPDMFALGKGLSGSMPLAASVGRAELMDLYPPGSMTSTWSGHALSCAAGRANLELLRERKLVERAREAGERLHARIAAWPEKFPHVGEVAGRGLMAAFYVARPGSREPDAETAFDVVREAVERGLMLFAPVGPGSGTIKLCPPLTVSDAALDEGLDVLEEALARSG